MSEIKSSRLLWFTFPEKPISEVEGKLSQLFSKIKPMRGNNDVYYVIKFHSSKTECYLWMAASSIDVRHVLLGLNPDGSKREEIVVDSDWVPYTDDEIRIVEAEMESTKNWGDKAELENKLEIMRLNERPTRLIQKPGLIEIPFEFQAGWAHPPPPGHETNKLVTVKFSPAKSNHLDIIEGKLFDHFYRFTANNTTGEKTVVVNGKRIRRDIRYPWISHDHKGKIYVTFDPESDDASIALTMTTSCKVTVKMPDGTTYDYNFWYHKR